MDRSAFLTGVREVVPAVISTAPFGMLIGATAVQAGFSPVSATALSLFAFAATAQFAAVELLQQGATLYVVLLTAVLINLRYVIFSASLSPKVAHLSRPWRAVVAFPLFDINYALAVAHFSDTDPAESHRGWYFVGASLPLIVALVLGTLAGAIVGQSVGEGLHLDFVIPLIFLSLLAPQVDGRPSLLAAVGAGGVAVLGVGLPFNLGLLIATGAGTAVGVMAARQSWRGPR